MRVEISRDSVVDISDVLARSRFQSDPTADGLLRQYIAKSTDLWIGKADGVVACICGLIAPTMLSNQAYLWMFHTNLVEDHAFMFIRHSQRWIEELLKTYTTIHGHAIAGNDRTIRWLQWLGATFSEPVGKNIPFMIRANG